LGLGFKQRVAEVFIGGIVNILICVEMQEDAIGEQKLEGGKAEVIHDDEPIQLANEVIGKALHAIALHE
jgi:hypothetical protein